MNPIIHPDATSESSAGLPPGSSALREGVTLKKIVRATWNGLVGVLLCQGLLGSILVIGWTYRLLQRQVFKRWWRKSTPAQTSFAAFIAEWEPDLAHAPNWILSPGFWSARRSPGGGEKARFFPRPFWRNLGGSLWENGRLGLQGILNTWVLTLPGCALMFFSWYDGWNNSFNKGYEQFWVGPTLGLVGIAFLIAAMLYVPLAQVRQAVTGQWRSFYQFGLVWELVRQRWLSCLGLALLYSAVSMPVMLLKSAPQFFSGNNAAIESLAPAEALRNLKGFFLLATLVFFPAYLLVRMVAGRLYASAMLGALRAGRVRTDALGEKERAVLERLKRVQVAPVLVRHPVVEVVVRTGSWVSRAAAVGLSCLIWFTFVAQIYVAQFVKEDRPSGWLNQPLVQLPRFGYYPSALKDPKNEIIVAVLVLAGCGLAWILRSKLQGLLRARANRTAPLTTPE